ncbi:mucin-4-like [Littorina saxatilis]|uniref:Uncharacterized protein n=1 Tax=Littorina saxatilis TaxID=31220 RepID=A0AAN9G136_9CAEN
MNKRPAPPWDPFQPGLQVKRPRHNNPPSPPPMGGDNKLSGCFDLSLKVYVSGFYIQGMMCQFAQSLAPTLRQKGPRLIQELEEGCSRFVSTFMFREWENGKIPLLKPSVIPPEEAPASQQAFPTQRSGNSGNQAGTNRKRSLVPSVLQEEAAASEQEHQTQRSGNSGNQDTNNPKRSVLPPVQQKEAPVSEQVNPNPQTLRSGNSVTQGEEHLKSASLPPVQQEEAPVPERLNPNPQTQHSGEQKESENRGQLRRSSEREGEDSHVAGQSDCPNDTQPNRSPCAYTETHALLNRVAKTQDAPVAKLNDRENDEGPNPSADAVDQNISGTKCQSHGQSNRSSADAGTQTVPSLECQETRNPTSTNDSGNAEEQNAEDCQDESDCVTINIKLIDYKPQDDVKEEARHGDCALTHCQRCGSDVTDSESTKSTPCCAKQAKQTVEKFTQTIKNAKGYCEGCRKLEKETDHSESGHPNVDLCPQFKSENETPAVTRQRGENIEKDGSRNQEVMSIQQSPESEEKTKEDVPPKVDKPSVGQQSSQSVEKTKERGPSQNEKSSTPTLRSEGDSETGAPAHTIDQTTQAEPHTLQVEMSGRNPPLRTGNDGEKTEEGCEKQQASFIQKPEAQFSRTSSQTANPPMTSNAPFRESQIQKGNLELPTNTPMQAQSYGIPYSHPNRNSEQAGNQQTHQYDNAKSLNTGNPQASLATTETFSRLVTGLAQAFISGAQSGVGAPWLFGNPQQLLGTSPRMPFAGNVAQMIAGRFCGNQSQTTRGRGQGSVPQRRICGNGPAVTARNTAQSEHAQSCGYPSQPWRCHGSRPTQFAQVSGNFVQRGNLMSTAEEQAHMMSMQKCQAVTPGTNVIDANTAFASFQTSGLQMRAGLDGNGVYQSTPSCPSMWHADVESPLNAHRAGQPSVSSGQLDYASSITQTPAERPPVQSLQSDITSQSLQTNPDQLKQTPAKQERTSGQPHTTSDQLRTTVRQIQKTVEKLCQKQAKSQSKTKLSRKDRGESVVSESDSASSAEPEVSTKVSSSVAKPVACFAVSQAKKWIPIKLKGNTNDCEKDQPNDRQPIQDSAGVTVGSASTSCPSAETDVRISAHDLNLSHKTSSISCKQSNTADNPFQKTDAMTVAGTVQKSPTPMARELQTKDTQKDTLKILDKTTKATTMTTTAQEPPFGMTKELLTLGHCSNQAYLNSIPVECIPLPLPKKADKREQQTETEHKSPAVINRRTMTVSPRLVNRRVMTDRPAMMDSGTVTEPVIQKAVSTLTERIPMRDSSTLTRSLRSIITRSAQTEAVILAEAATSTLEAPHYVTADRATMTERTEDNQEVKTTTPAARKTQNVATQLSEPPLLNEIETLSKPDAELVTSLPPDMTNSHGHVTTAMPELFILPPVKRTVLTCVPSGSESSANTGGYTSLTSNSAEGEEGTVRITVRVRVGKNLLAKPSM